MFLTKKHLSRRTLLKGAGVSLALPLLDAMIPAATVLSQTAAARKLRAGFFYLPHGMIMNNTTLGAAMDRWTPSGSGADFKLNAITKSLEPYKKYVTSLGNIKNDAAKGVHTRNAGTWLGGMNPVAGKMSATLDQVIADQIGPGARLRSLEVASESTVQQRSGNGGPYSVISARDETAPLQMEYNSRKVFLKLFHDDKGHAITQENERENASLLDLINSQTRALQRDLGPSDRAILNSHLTANTHPLPTLLIGGAGGKLTGGRHLELPSPTPIANLHLTLLGTLGIERKTFGDSTGTIAL